MSVDFTGRWTAKLGSDSFLPGIEAGALVLTIDHVEPLLQVKAIASAPHYSLGHIQLNYRTDGIEVDNTTHSMKVRTTAHWDGNKLAVQIRIKIGNYERHVRSIWRLSKNRNELTVRREEPESAPRVTVLHRHG
jgi:hypothetical protein